MWINRKLNENQQYLYPASNEKDLYDKFLNHIFKWAAINKNSSVHLWYDSALTPAQAIKTTQEFITHYTDTHPELAPIVLRDVRELPDVIANPVVFSDKTPIFFRVDLLRVIAQYHDIVTKVTPYFVYSDLDIDPLTEQEIFDKETMHNLETFGIVMAYHPIWQNYENSFSIISNHNPYLLDAMKYAMIDLNIARAYNALEGKFYRGDHTSEAMYIVQKKLQNQQKTAQPSQQSLSVPKNYSINIFQINKKLNEMQPFIHPGLNDEELFVHFFQPIFELAMMNPQGVINLWFDSATTTTIAVQNTVELINNLHPELSNIMLRDIRQLPYIQMHPDIFSKRTTTHFQEKLLQIVAALFDISTGKTLYCMHGDVIDLIEYKDLFNLKTLCAEELFDEASLKDLQKFGITSINNGGIKKEIIGSDNPYIFEILTNDWLTPTIEKAYSKLYGTECYGQCCQSFATLQQIIYISYVNMFKYFYHHAGLGKLFIEQYDHASQQFISHEYNKYTDGLLPFGLDRLGTGGYFQPTTQLAQEGIGQIWTPRKKIAKPAPTLIYDDTAPVRSLRSTRENDPKALEILKARKSNHYNRGRHGDRF